MFISVDWNDCTIHTTVNMRRINYSGIASWSGWGGAPGTRYIIIHYPGGGGLGSGTQHRRARCGSFHMAAWGNFGHYGGGGRGVIVVTPLISKRLKLKQATHSRPTSVDNLLWGGGTQKSRGEGYSVVEHARAMI